jgi:hypothetical protein
MLLIARMMRLLALVDPQLYFHLSNNDFVANFIIKRRDRQHKHKSPYKHELNPSKSTPSSTPNNITTGETLSNSFPPASKQQFQQ